VLGGAFLLLFLVASPLYLQSAAILVLGGVIAHAAAWTLVAIGVGAHAEANVLLTPRGAFMVTGACVATPLIPVYLAAVFAYAPTGKRLVSGLLIALPLFLGLGIARLLVVALPATLVGSPLLLVHAFHQLLLGAVVVTGAAVWCHGGRAAVVPALAGVATGAGFALLVGPAYTAALGALLGMPPVDPQHAIAWLPAFQIALFLAVWVAALVSLGSRTLLSGLALLALSHAVGLLALQRLAVSADPTVAARAWAVAGPVLLCAALVHRARAHR